MRGGPRRSPTTVTGAYLKVVGVPGNELGNMLSRFGNPIRIGIGLGVAMGVIFGAVIGSVTGSAGLWVAIGLVIGTIVGVAIGIVLSDQEAD